MVFFFWPKNKIKQILLMISIWRGYIISKVQSYRIILYSMKRNTINQIRFNEPIRALKKNKTCQLEKKLMGNLFKQKNTNSNNKFISTAVANLLMNQLLDQLGQAFRASDQRQFHQHLHHIINQSSLSLQRMFNPIPYPQETNIRYVYCQAQPHSVNGDIMCGGNTITYQFRAKQMPRASLKLNEQILNKQKNQFSHSKKIINYKDQHHQIWRGLQPLQKQKEILLNDPLEDILRQKFIKDKNIQYKKQLQNERPVILPTIQQQSFDYDGAIFPIKRNSIQNVTKLKILNTTCRVIDRGIADNKKTIMGSKLKGAHLKTQLSEDYKDIKRNVQKQQQRIFSQRRHSNTESMKDLLRICTEGEQNLKMKIEQRVHNKGIKLRQLRVS